MNTFLFILWGFAFGSFANVCIYRLPKGGSLTQPPSQCPNCRRRIRWYENIPVISYLALRGRCAGCRKRIPIRYLISEIVLGLYFALCAFVYGTSSPQIWYVAAIGFFAYTISVIDYDHYIIPDELSLGMLVLGWLSAYWNPWLNSEIGWHRIVESVLCGLLAGSFMLLLAWIGEKLFKKEALGGGDVKLMAAVGAVLSWRGVWETLLIGSIAGSIVGLALIALRKKGRRETIPFGPFLSAGMVLSAFFSGFLNQIVFP